MIQIKDLSVVLDNQTIFHNANIQVEDGKRTVFVGKSGCGKTVLMKAIEGLIECTSGDIIVDGVNICTSSYKKILQIRKSIAMLFQSSALMDSMNIYQNVAFPLFEHKKNQFSEKEIKDLVVEKLESVGLYNVLKKMPSELSGGMKKRVALARAIILEPKYIIYDEPTTGLDPGTSKDIIDLINKIHKMGFYTSIIISHDRDCIKETADRIAFIDKTKIIEFKDPTKFDFSVYNKHYK